MQIRDYIIRRLMILPILIIGTSIIVFALTRIGGSPIGIYLSHEMSPAEVQEMKERFHLDKPVPCLLYTSPSPRDQRGSRMPSSA